jgi:hypothetical protein
MVIRYVVRVCACLALVAVAGCGTRPPAIVPVAGVVLINGAPVPNVRVQFIPQIENARDYLAQGTTDSKGQFTLTCQDQEGACATENIVVLSEDIPEQLTRSDDKSRAAFHQYMQNLKNRPIPPQYLTAAESPLRITVSADRQEYKIELKR